MVRTGKNITLGINCQAFRSILMPLLYGERRIMQPINTFDIQQELEQKVEGHDDLAIFASKYPTRVLITLNFQIDGKEYKPSGSYFINQNGDIEIEKAV